MPLTPEQRAREEIDEQLESCGWVIQDFTSMKIHGGHGVAVREYPLKWKDGEEFRSGFADYLLYADGRAIGIVEAKPAGHTLQGVVVQSKRYTEGLDTWVPAWRRPLHFAYESTGEITQFTNGLGPPSAQPGDLHLSPPRGSCCGSITCNRLSCAACSVACPIFPRAVSGLCSTRLSETWSGRSPRPAPGALIQMATGSGKTFTAVSACHRLIKHAKARRILFLVDRNNLGRQTLNEFQRFRDPSSAYTFAEEFVVQLLRGNVIDPASKIVITTIQRLYSILKGDLEYDPANEEESLFESARLPRSEPVPVEYTPDLPIETFDFIIIDEWPPLDLQRLAAGDRILRRFPDRAHRDPESPNDRVLPQQHRAGLFAHEGGGGRG